MIARPSPPSIEAGCSPSERRNARRYYVEVGVASAVYVGLLFLSAATVDHARGLAKIGLALMPMIGVGGMAVAIVRLALRQDELQRHTMVVSAAIAGLGCALITMVLGFLENAGMPPVTMTSVWPITAVTFALAFPFVRRRFR